MSRTEHLVPKPMTGPRPVCPTCFIESQEGKQWKAIIRHPKTAVYVQFGDRSAWFCTPDHARMWFDHFYGFFLIGKWKKMDAVREGLNAP